LQGPDFTGARWRKPATSGDGGCVEVAYADGWVGVRDTKATGSGPVLAYTEREWTAFLAGVRSGEFDVAALVE
jgi:predicted secreted Zn-dependent protease